MTIPDYVAIGVLVVCLMVWAGTAQRATWRNWFVAPRQEPDRRNNSGSLPMLATLRASLRVPAEIIVLRRRGAITAQRKLTGAANG